MSDVNAALAAYTAAMDDLDKARDAWESQDGTVGISDAYIDYIAAIDAANAARDALIDTKETQ